MRKSLAVFAFLGLSFLVLGLWSARPAPARIVPGVEALSEKVLGAEDAPITFLEFASLTCSHCATFHEEVFPVLKREYIDTGKMRFIYYDFPLDPFALRASMLARCAGNKRYFAFLKVLFKQQKSWANSEDPIESLKRIAKLGGMSSDDFRFCLSNKGLERGILQMRLGAEKAFKVESIPTFVINGEKYTGDHSFEALDKVLRKLLPDS